jgi:hypothetical protein
MVEHGRESAGNAAFHVDGAAPVHLAAGNLAGKWRMLPGLFVARRHDIGVARENQIRRGRADARIEVLDIVGTGIFSRNDSAPPSAGVTDGQRSRSRVIWAGFADT